MAICRLCEVYNFEKYFESWEEDPDGLCLLHSQQSDKDKDGKFIALIEELKEQKKSYFAGVLFPGNISFQGFQFTKISCFYMASFLGSADFSEAIFLKPAIFTKASFLDKAVFFGATFKSSAIFQLARFSKEALFSSATFSSETLFYKTSFSIIIALNNCNFLEKSNIILSNINPIKTEETTKQKMYAPFWANFSSLRIKPGASLTLRTCKLTQVRFEESDVSRIEFDRVTWASRWGRSAVYDELVWREKKEGSPEAVERLYRQLKSNYEEKKDYKRVGDFHYGEMEMHRLGSPWRRRFPFSWYNLYWALNGYGERPLRALIWFGVFLLTFTGLIWSQGLTVTGDVNPAGLWQSFRFVLEKATLQRPTWGNPVTSLGEFLATLSPLFLPGQAALFFLALRNRLGRRR
jgi:uncharacterized protein YjbI with pentapeptide repeats